MTLPVGSSAPDFSLPDQEGKTQSLSAQRGKWVLLYFYPKDDTSGCTAEACGFRDQWAELQKLNVVVFGVSADTVDSHQAFAKKFSLPFPLLADTDKSVIQAYGAWGEKFTMGHKRIGILRMSYLIDPSGKIAHAYPKVATAEHAEQVLRDLEALYNRKA